MQIGNSIALVTGANRGLGLAFTRELVRRGAARVYGAARQGMVVTACTLYGARCHSHALSARLPALRRCHLWDIRVAGGLGKAVSTPLRSPAWATGRPG